MKFEEMQVIWDSQEQRKVFGFDTAGIHRAVGRRSRREGFASNLEEFGMIAICLFVALNQGLEPLLEGTDPHQYLAAALFIGVALYTWRLRKRRLRDEQSFDSTLLGDLDRAIHRVECQVRRAQTFLWWFMLPSVIVILVSFSQKPEIKFWNTLVVGLSFILGYAVTQMGLRCRLLPAKRDLVGLRAKLFESA